MLTMKKASFNNVFIVLGIAWLIMGLFIYPSSAIWPLGIIFLIIGIIRKVEKSTERIIT